MGMYTVKKVNGFPVPSRDVTNQSLPGRELFKYSPPGRGWLVTSLLKIGKTLTFFYSDTRIALGMNFTELPYDLLLAFHIPNNTNTQGLQIDVVYLF
jgi:hypothetical protein